MSEIYDYLNLGIRLANQHADLNTIFKNWPKDRIVVLVVCRPHAEVESYIKNWLTLYANRRLQEGAVQAETFTVWLDASGQKYQFVLDSKPATEPTVQAYINEGTFWDISGRVNTLYTAYIQGKPMVIKSKDAVELRDLVHLDEIMNVIHRTLVQRGYDMASILK